MAEQPTDATQQPPADVKEEDTKVTNMADVSADYKQEDTDIPLNVKQQHSEDPASPSATTSGETKHESDANMEQADVENSDTAEGVVPLTEGVSSDSTLTEHSDPPQADDGSHGDYNRDTRSKQTTVRGEHHTEETKAPETASSSAPGDREEDQVDGPEARLNKETTGPIDTEAGEDDGSGLKKVLSPEEENDIQENTTSPQETSVEERRNIIETIGPTTQETTEPTGGSRRYLIAVGIVVLVAILVQLLLPPEPPPQKTDMRQIDVFLRELDKIKTEFPNQRAELWSRSKIHLLRHLKTAQPTEPVSLILTAGLRAERTLRCLAQGLASAFSSALNASVLHIDGASKASQDSDQVKLDIDSNLQGAFEGDKPVAVIHRFEELPPGSTLIFYRYCDHENAAYKKTCLIFTVLLEEEEEIPAKSRLSTVEEMVDDHLQKKFLSDGHPVSFDRMDLDKYGGLWSRISHLILPVAAEETIEHEGCLGI